VNTPQPGSCTYELDDQLRIVAVDSAWDDFARGNAAAHLAGAALLGRAVLPMIAGDATRHLYETMFACVKRSGRTIVVPFRCDSPHLRRFLTLAIGRGDGRLHMRSTLLRAEPRPAAPALFFENAGNDERLRMCSFCKRVKADEVWCEVEEAMARLKLFEAASIPSISHGVCPPCLETALKELDGEG
jgi:hypothetical protein